MKTGADAIILSCTYVDKRLELDTTFVFFTDCQCIVVVFYIEIH